MQDLSLSYSNIDTLLCILDYPKASKLYCDHYYYIGQIKQNLNTLSERLRSIENKTDSQLKDLRMLIGVLESLKVSLENLSKKEPSLDHSFKLLILNSAMCIDVNDDIGLPKHFSKTLVKDIFTLQKKFKDDIHKMLLTDNYEFTMEHFNQLVNQSKNIGFLSLKINQLIKLRNFIVTNRSYIRKSNYAELHKKRSYTDMLKGRNTIMQVIAEGDLNKDNDFFGGRYDKRDKSFDDIETTMDNTEYGKFSDLLW